MINTEILLLQRFALIFGLNCMLYDMILFNFLLFALETFSFWFQLSLKFAHLEVEIIMARATISENTVENKNEWYYACIFCTSQQFYLQNHRVRPLLELTIKP